MKSLQKRLIATVLCLAIVMAMTMALGIIPPIETHALSAEEGGEGRLYITSPSHGAKINGNEDITIKWKSVPGADHYWLTIKGTSINDSVGNETSYIITPKDKIFVTDGKEYKIYVAAMDSNGNVLNNTSEWNAIYVINNMEAPLEVSEDYLEFDADGGKATFKIYADSAYKVTENLSWISLSSTSGSSDKKITVTCNENTSTEDREGKITVKHTATGEKYTVDVCQKGKKVYATISNFELSSYKVREGQSITLSGIINGNGKTIEAVAVSIFDADDHTKGARHVRVTPNTSTYDLSKISEIVTGTTVASSSFKLEAGKSYDVVVYVGLANSEEGFESDPTETFEVVDNILETPTINKYGLTNKHCVDEPLIVSWDAVDGADDYKVYVKKLDGAPDLNNDNEPGVNISYNWLGNTGIEIAASKLVAGKYYKIALCATNSKQNIDSEWTTVYVLMQESGYISVSETPNDLGAKKGSTGSFWIETNLDFNISCNASWLTWTINKQANLAKINLKTTSANTGTSNRKAKLTISADGVDDKYVYVYQLAPEAELPSITNINIPTEVEIGKPISYSAEINGNGALIQTVTVSVHSIALQDTIYFRNTNVNAETYTLNGSMNTGGVVSGTDEYGKPKTLDLSRAGEYQVCSSCLNECIYK